MLFEHINLFVPDPGLSKAFYLALGCALNPRGTNERQVHVNAGFSQLHLPFKRNMLGDPVVEAQAWAGTVELWTTEAPDVILARLQADPVLAAAGVAAELLQQPCRLLVRGPWEVRPTWLLSAAPAGFAAALAAAGRGHAGGLAGIVAMPRVTHPCPRGHAQHIAAFYRKVLGVDASLAVAEETGLATAAISFRAADTLPLQTLEYEEQEGSPPADAYDQHEVFRYHVCLYLDTDEAFERAYRSAEAAGLVWVNERFEGGPIRLQSARTWAEADEVGQFRVKDLRDPSSGALGIVLEHEIRCRRHTSCPLAVAAAGS